MRSSRKRLAETIVAFFFIVLIVGVALGRIWSWAGSCQEHSAPAEMRCHFFINTFPSAVATGLLVLIVLIVLIGFILRSFMQSDSGFLENEVDTNQSDS